MADRVQPLGHRSPNKRILVISNDSAVFLSSGFVSAYDMFGGRLTEVKNLVDRLKGVGDVSFAIISGKFGLVPSNFVIGRYDWVPSRKEDYAELQKRKDFVGQVQLICRAFDRIIVCVPKDMFTMLMPVLPEDRVIAVTSNDFREECEKNGWTFYPRKGTRVGRENADAIVDQIDEYVRSFIPIL